MTGASSMLISSKTLPLQAGAETTKLMQFLGSSMFSNASNSRHVTQ